MLLSIADRGLGSLFHALAATPTFQTGLAWTGRGISKLWRWFSDQDGATQAVLVVSALVLAGLAAYIRSQEKPDWDGKNPASGLSQSVPERSSAVEPRDGDRVAVNPPKAVEPSVRAAPVFGTPIRSVSPMSFRLSRTWRVVVADLGRERQLRLVRHGRRYDCSDARSGDLVASLERMGSTAQLCDASGAVMFLLKPGSGWYSWSVSRVAGGGDAVECEVENPGWATFECRPRLGPRGGVRWWVTSGGTRIARFYLAGGALRVEYAPGIALDAHADSINAVALLVATRWT
jgi:hypothetical protein